MCSILYQDEKINDERSTKEIYQGSRTNESEDEKISLWYETQKRYKIIISNTSYCYCKKEYCKTQYCNETKISYS